MNTIGENLCVNMATRPKTGEELCEDVVCGNKSESRFAVADGVSNSFFSEIFAELITQEFCYGERIDLLFNKDTVMDWLIPIQKNWIKKVTESLSLIKESKWIFNNRFFRGDPAETTLTGIQLFTKNNKIKLRAAILGDSCLFHIREKEIISVHLIKCSNEFTEFPDHFSSYPTGVRFKPTYFQFNVQQGDYIILGTDKISEWILMHHETSSAKWTRCLRWLDKFCKGTFKLETITNHARNARTGLKMGNDDVGLIVMEI